MSGYQQCSHSCGKIVQRRLPRLIRNKNIGVADRELREEFCDVSSRLGIPRRAGYFTRGIVRDVMNFWKNMLLAHLHYRLEMGRLIESIEWRYDDHPYQPNAEIDQ